MATIKPLALARLLGVVFQEHAPPFPFTVLDVIRMGRAPHLRFFASPSAADTAIAEGIVARLGLTHLVRTVTELARSGLTVIMTTHAPDQALLLDGKVALLRTAASSPTAPRRGN